MDLAVHCYTIVLQPKETLILTYYQAESVTKGCLGPSQAVVRQVDVLCCAIDVASTHPSSWNWTEQDKLLHFTKKTSIRFFRVSF